MNKKNLPVQLKSLLFLFCFFYLSQLHAATRTWTGGTSNVWTLAANWSGGVVPAATGDDVIIGTGTFSPVTSTNVSVNTLVIDPSATLTLGVGFTFDITSTVANPACLINGTFNFATGTTGNTVTIAGIFNCSSTGTLNIPAVTGTLHVLNLGGSDNIMTGTFTTSTATPVCNVHYTGATQTIFNSPNYRILTIDNAGIKTLTGTALCTVNTSMSLTAGSTFSMGNATNPPSLAIKGALAIPTGTTFDFGGVSLKTVTVQGTITTGGTVTMAGAGLAHVLNLQSTAGINSLGTFNTTAGSGSTVFYNSTTAQNMAISASYQNLTIDGTTSTKTMLGAITVNGNLTITSGTLATAAQTLTLLGNMTNNATFSSTTGIVILNGTTPQTIGGTSNTTFYNFVNNNAAAPVTCASNIVVTGTATLNPNTKLDLGTNPNCSLGTSATGTGTLALSALTGSTIFPTSTSGPFFGASGGTVEYNNNTNYTIGNNPAGYKNIVLSGGGTKTFSNAAVTPLLGDLKIAAATTLSLTNTNTEINLKGNLLNDGIITTGTGTIVTFSNATVNQVISGTGTTTFDKILLDKSGFDVMLSMLVRVNNSIGWASAGKLQIINFDLTLAPACIFINYDTDKFVATNGSGIFVKEGTTAANFQQVYPIGYGTTYTPFYLTSFTATVAGTGTLKMKSLSNGACSNCGLSYLSLTSQNITSNTAANFQFRTATAGTTYTTVTRNGTPIGAPNQQIAQIVSPFQDFGPNGSGGLAIEGDWRLLSIPNVFYSKQNGAFESTATWSTISHSDATGCACLPAANSVVHIGGADSVYVSTTNAITLDSLQIDAGAVFDIGSFGSNITVNKIFRNNGIGGNGKLKIKNSGGIAYFVNMGGSSSNDFLNAPGTGASTVDYYGAANYSIANPPQYQNLEISAAGTLNPTTTTVIKGDFKLAASATFQPVNYDFTAEGTAYLGGLFQEIGSTGLDLFAGNVLISPTGFIAVGSGSADNVEFRGNITNDGYINILGTGTVTFKNIKGLSANPGSTTNIISPVSMQGQWAFTGTGPVTFQGNFTIAPASSVDNYLSNVTIMGILNGANNTTSKWTNMSGSWLKYQNAIVPMATGMFLVTNVNNTVEYGGSGNQEVKLGSYYNLIASGTGTKSPGTNGTVSALGDLTVAGGTTLAPYGSFTFSTFNVNGILSGAGTIDLSPGAFNHGLELKGATNSIGTFIKGVSTVRYSGSTNQNVFASNYYKLEVSGAGTDKVLQGTIDIEKDLNLNNAILDLQAFNVTMPYTATITPGVAFGDNNMVRTASTGSMSVSWQSGLASFTYPVGSVAAAANRYTPLTINLSGYSGAGSIGVRVSTGVEPHTLNPATTLPLSRHWLLTSSGLTGGTGSIVATYNDVDPQSDETLYLPGRWDGSAWTKGTVGDVAEGTNIITFSAITSAMMNGNNYTAGPLEAFSSETITTSAITPTSFCQGATVNVPFTITGTFTPGNIFTAQLSDYAGGFSTPTDIGTLTSTTAGTIAATIPMAQAIGIGYRIRVISNTPAVVGTDNGTNLTISAPVIALGTITPTAYCPGASVSVPFTVSCSFGASNVFTAELSDASGNFTAPTSIGTLTSTTSGTIAAMIPYSTASGTLYKIRVTGNNPVVQSTASPNLTVNPIPVSSVLSTSTTICAGSNGTIESFASGFSLQWLENGLPVTNGGFYSGATTNTLSLTAITSAFDSKVYSLVVTNPLGCKDTSNTGTILFVPIAPSIPTTADKSVCQGTDIALTGTGSTGGTAIQYTFWNAASSGTQYVTSGGYTYSSPTLSNSTLPTASYNYYVEALNSAACTSATRKAVIVTVTAPLTVATDPDTYACGTSSVAFSGTATGSPTGISWDFGDGSPAATGSFTASYSYSTSGTYNAVLTVSKPGCTDAMISRIITVNPITLNSVSIVSDDVDNIICSGTLVNFTATAINGGTTPIYQWKINGAAVGSDASTFSSPTLNNLDAVTVDLSTSNPCASPANTTSNTITMSVIPGVTIPDANFRAWLTSTYPACMCGNNLITTCTGIINATSVNVSGLSISDLTGIQYFTGLTKLDCSSNTIATSGFPSISTLTNLTTLDCHSNALITLPGLPASLTYFNASDNDLIDLTGLPAGVTHVFVGDFNNFNTWPPELSASNTSLVYLDIAGHFIPGISSFAPNLDTLIMNNSSNIASIPTLPSGLIYFDIHKSNLNAVPDFSTATPNLLHLDIGDNAIPALTGAFPTALRYLDCSDNYLTTILTLPNTLATLKGTLNPYPATNICYPNTPTTPYGGSFTADIPSCNVIITSFSSPSGCVGDSIDINGTGFNGTTAVSFNGTNAGFTFKSIILVTAKIPAGATTGTVTLTATGGTGISPSTFTINPTPFIGAAPTTSLCDGATTNIAPTSTPIGASYSWTASTSGSASGFSAGSGTSIAQTLTSGGTISTVTYIVKPILAGCIGTPQNIDIQVNPAPIVNPQTTSTICSGQTTFIIPTSTIAGVVFSWTASTGGSISGFSTGTGGSIAQLLTNTGTAISNVTYGVKATLNTCPGPIQNIDVNVNPVITVDAQPASTICEGNITSIALTSPSPGASFSWTASTTGTASGFSTDGGNTISQTLLSGGTSSLVTYEVIATLGSCSSSVQNIEVTVNTTPIASITINPDKDTLCSGEDAVITLQNSQVGITYSAFNIATPVGNTITGDGSNVLLTIPFNELSAGTNGINIKASILGCPSTPLTEMSTFYKSDITKPAILSNFPNLCNTTPVVFTVPAIFNTYQWYYGTTASVSNASQLINGGTNSEIIYQPGYYFIKLSDTLGCSAITAGQYIDYGTSTPTVAQSASTGTQIDLNCPIPSASYQWYVENASGQLKYIQGANTASFRAYFDGTYYVAVKFNNCYLYSAFSMVSGMAGGNVLKQGFFENDSSIVIPELNFATTMEVLPNPSNGNFEVHYLSTSDEQSIITLYTTSGQPLARKETKEKGFITVPFTETALSTGVYIIEMIQQETVIRKKIMIVR